MSHYYLEFGSYSVMLMEIDSKSEDQKWNWPANANKSKIIEQKSRIITKFNKKMYKLRWEIIEN